MSKKNTRTHTKKPSQFNKAQRISKSLGSVFIYILHNIPMSCQGQSTYPEWLQHSKPMAVSSQWVSSAQYVSHQWHEPAVIVLRTVRLWQNQRLAVFQLISAQDKKQKWSEKTNGKTEKAAFTNFTLNLLNTLLIDDTRPGEKKVKTNSSACFRRDHLFMAIHCNARSTEWMQWQELETQLLISGDPPSPHPSSYVTETEWNCFLILFARAKSK